MLANTAKIWYNCLNYKDGFWPKIQSGTGVKMLLKSAKRDVYSFN